MNFRENYYIFVFLFATFSFVLGFLWNFRYYPGLSKLINNKVISAGTQSYFPGVPCIWVEDQQYVYDEGSLGEVWDMLVINK